VQAAATVQADGAVMLFEPLIFVGVLVFVFIYLWRDKE
jgi:NADH:ubiquinone oxidoreductase subunit 3 (subunit A)